MIKIHSYPKAVLHVDCDAFFASVEQSLNPDYKNRPLVTGKERGIASAVSYEAKKMGVLRGMRIFEVKKVCPDCIVIPSDYEAYSLVSKRLFEILRRFTPDVEEYSIDEAFADITGLRRVYRTSYEAIAEKIQETVCSELGLTVSIGLSCTKSLAKICSKERKPAGLTCVKGRDLHRFLCDMPVDRVCGFGPSAVALLKKNRIVTVLDFIQKPNWLAQRLLGKIGDELWHELRGEQIYAINHSVKTKPYSVNKAKTFTPPTDHRDFVRAQLFRNAESAFIRLRRHKLSAKKIGISLRDEEFRTAGFEALLTYPAVSVAETAGVLSRLFDLSFNPARKYRQTGIYLTDFYEISSDQKDFFLDDVRIQKMKRLADCSDRINKSYGKHSLHLGAAHAVHKFNQHLGERGDIHPRKINRLKGETDSKRLNIPLWQVKV